jgi:hypothetical protein
MLRQTRLKRQIRGQKITKTQNFKIVKNDPKKHKNHL